MIYKWRSLIDERGVGLQEMEAYFHNRAMTVEHPQSGKLDTYLCEMIQHVVNHGTYHRGNLTAMIRQQGFLSVSNDDIVYLYER